MHNQASRRQFLRESASYAVAFAGLQEFCSGARGAVATPLGGAGPYGALRTDPAGVLDLPAGFKYQVLSRAGDRMDDGLLAPGLPDGMATFPGPDGLTLLLRNHEMEPQNPGAFGPKNELLSRVDAKLLYDLGAGEHPGSGGVTTLVYDTRRQRVVRQSLTLGGTVRNCAGGPTPWGTWVSCEEATDTAGPSPTYGTVCDVSHGYAFEVPARAEPGLVAAKPLRAMGRFRREAIAVDEPTGLVYQTEDIDDGLLYRFTPNRPGDLAAGGRLHALAVVGRDAMDTRNWHGAQACRVGESMPVRWVELDDVESPHDDLRYRGHALGAARFARGEGIWSTPGALVFASTSGGAKEIGQLWKLTPGRDGAEDRLELFLEPNDQDVLMNADNLTAAPWGDLIVCEDRQTEVVRLIGVTPEGGCYTLARNRLECEFAGVCFSPDGTTMFVNIQTAGLTLAVTGPWAAANR